MEVNECAIKTDIQNYTVIRQGRTWWKLQHTFKAGAREIKIRLARKAVQEAIERIYAVHTDYDGLWCWD